MYLVLQVADSSAPSSPSPKPKWKQDLESKHIILTGVHTTYFKFQSNMDKMIELNSFAFIFSSFQRKITTDLIL